MPQSSALFDVHVMMTAFVAAAAVGLAVWATARLLRARAELQRLRNPDLDELTLRVEAQAVLSARLARGEIDRDAYARALLQLEGILGPAATAPDSPETTQPTAQ